MHSISRKDFIKTSALAGLALAMPPSFKFKKYSPLLSFSTLGCPDWSLDTIVNFAAKNKFNGIEIRGILRELDLPKREEFSTDERIASVVRFVKDRRIKIVNLGSSAAMHFPKGPERDRNIEDAKNFIRLAKKLSCPYVRVFPNNFPKDQDKEETINLMVESLKELGDFAKGYNVHVLMETHGDLSQSDEIQKIMERVNNPNTGLVWDVVNMWTVTKEPPSTVYPKLKKYIRHVHLKDVISVDGKDQYVMLGRGIAPVFEAVDLLAKDEFKGHYSFEWEKLWHPEIGEPAIAIADYSKVMKEHFKKLGD